MGDGRYYEIKVPCELCQTYALEDCKKCPFNFFRNLGGGKVGRDTFIRMITHTEELPIFLGFNVIRWDASEDKEARAFLRLICKEAKKRISFV